MKENQDKGMTSKEELAINCLIRRLSASIRNPDTKLNLMQGIKDNRMLGMKEEMRQGIQHSLTQGIKENKK